MNRISIRLGFYEFGEPSVHPCDTSFHDVTTALRALDRPHRPNVWSDGLGDHLRFHSFKSLVTSARSELKTRNIDSGFRKRVRMARKMVCHEGQCGCCLNRRGRVTPFLRERAARVETEGSDSW